MRSPVDAPRWTGEATIPAGARRWQVALGTERGPMRHVNEDALLTDAGLRLVLVLDGMGGIASGARAAEVAADGVLAHLRDHGGELFDALIAASARLAAAAEAELTLRGAGAAAVAARLGPEGAVVAHVGDCRAYAWRAGELTPLTVDHDLRRALVESGATADQIAEMMTKHPTVITTALGVGPPPTVDVTRVALAPGERLVLVTDGVHRLLDHAALTAALASDDAITRILDDVAARGGDNAAIAIIG